MQGIIYVRIRLRLDQDLTEQDVKEVVDGLDYSIKDTTGKASICDTEITDYE